MKILPLFCALIIQVLPAASAYAACEEVVLTLIHEGQRKDFPFVCIQGVLVDQEHCAQTPDQCGALKLPAVHPIFLSYSVSQAKAGRGKPGCE